MIVSYQCDARSHGSGAYDDHVPYVGHFAKDGFTSFGTLLQFYLKRIGIRIFCSEIILLRNVTQPFKLVVMEKNWV